MSPLSLYMNGLVLRQTASADLAGGAAQRAGWAAPEYGIGPHLKVKAAAPSRVTDTVHRLLGKVAVSSDVCERGLKGNTVNTAPSGKTTASTEGRCREGERLPGRPAGRTLTRRCRPLGVGGATHLSGTHGQAVLGQSGAGHPRRACSGGSGQCRRIGYAKLAGYPEQGAVVSLGGPHCPHCRAAGYSRAGSAAAYVCFLPRTRQGTAGCPS